MSFSYYVHLGPAYRVVASEWKSKGYPSHDLYNHFEGTEFDEWFTVVPPEASRDDEFVYFVGNRKDLPGESVEPKSEDYEQELSADFIFGENEKFALATKPLLEWLKTMVSDEHISLGFYAKTYSH